MKRGFLISVLLIVIIVCFSFCGCSGEDKEYFEKVSEYSFWDNEGSQAIPQYQVYNIVKDYLNGGEIKDGACITEEGKKRKVLFIGWDGARADAMLNLFYDSFSTNGYNYPVSDYSGLGLLKDEGGLYIAYAGGEKGTESQQEPSTCPGWSSEFTGGWHTTHGVETNDGVKDKNVDTFIMEYAKLGLNTSFAFEWGQLFDITWKEEVKYKMQNPDIPAVYCDINRTHAASFDEVMKNENIKKEKDMWVEDLDLYNYVANDELPQNSQTDLAMRDYLIERINMDDDIVAGIFHAPDTNGHTYEFSNNCGQYVNSIRNSDTYTYQLTELVKQRETEYNEEWLIIVTADHGGNKNGHGKQILEHRTIWIVCNQKLDKYFGSGYDGYKEN